MESLSSTRFSRTRGRDGTFSRGVLYPNPFFDVSQTYLPKTIKSLFEWCRYFFMVHPLINATVFKLSQYPIRDVVYHTEDQGLKLRWSTFMEDHLQYRSFMEEAGLDFFTYGNCLVSLSFPFVKKLTCAACKHTRAARDAKYDFRGFEFYWQCPSCGTHGPARARDEYVRASSDIRLVRWNPEDVDITKSEATGRLTYFYRIPTALRNDVMMGKKHILEEVPQLFIDAMKNRRSVVFADGALFHFKRPTLAGKDQGWGMPLVLPVLKDTFYLQILKKAQETIAMEHIVPLRTIFPQDTSTAAAYNSVNLGRWKDQIAMEINRWRRDNNYIPILPLPVGTQSIGGEGRALLLGQEVRIWSEQILAGMGVPSELIFGGVSYSGSNVSLRMLENFFIGYLQGHLRLLKWIIRSVGIYMDWPLIGASYKPFKMADDLQRQAYYFQLSQAGKISDSTLLSYADLDADKEDLTIQRETNQRADALKKAQIRQAEIQGEQSLVMARFQARAQREMAEHAATATPTPGEPGAEAEGVQGDSMSPHPDPQMMRAQAQMNPPPQVPRARMDTPNEMMGSRLGLGNALPTPAGPSDMMGHANLDLISQAQYLATQLGQMDSESRDAALMNLRSQSRELYSVVLSMLFGGGGGGAKNGAAGKPLPEQRPPRRGPGSALI